MSGIVAEVREVLAALTAKIASSKGRLAAQAIGTALYGLQRMNIDSAEVQDVLAELIIKLERSTDHTGSDLRFALRTVTYAIEVRHVLGALAPKLRQCTPEHRAQHLSNAFYGVRRVTMTCSKCAKFLQLWRLR
jgi:hypothetical protein